MKAPRASVTCQAWAPGSISPETQAARHTHTKSSWMSHPDLRFPVPGDQRSFLAKGRPRPRFFFFLCIFLPLSFPSFLILLFALKMSTSHSSIPRASHCGARPGLVLPGAPNCLPSSQLPVLQAATLSLTSLCVPRCLPIEQTDQC